MSHFRSEYYEALQSAPDGGTAAGLAASWETELREAESGFLALRDRLPKRLVTFRSKHTLHDATLLSTSSGRGDGPETSALMLERAGEVFTLVFQGGGPDAIDGIGPDGGGRRLTWLYEKVSPGTDGGGAHRAPDHFILTALLQDHPARGGGPVEMTVRFSQFNFSRIVTPELARRKREHRELLRSWRTENEGRRAA